MPVFDASKKKKCGSTEEITEREQEWRWEPGASKGGKQALS